MVRIGIIIISAAIIASIGLAISYYIDYQQHFIDVNSGEPVQFGPDKYIVENIG